MSRHVTIPVALIRYLITKPLDPVQQARLEAFLKVEVLLLEREAGQTQSREKYALVGQLNALRAIVAKKPLTASSNG